MQFFDKKPRDEAADRASFIAKAVSHVEREDGELGFEERRELASPLRDLVRHGGAVT
jgi:hypothetical protein